MIAKNDSSPDVISEILDWNKCGVEKLRAIDDFAKIPFKNIYDIDFVIASTETLLCNDAKNLNHIIKKGLGQKLILIGHEKNISKLTYILRGGIACYEPDIEKASERILDLFDRRIKEKERVLLVGAMLNDGSVIKKVKQALEKGDSRLMHKVIALSGKFLPLQLSLIKEYFSLIMKTVFEFAEEKGVRHIEKKELVSELMEMTDYESVKEYAAKKITGIIHLVEVNKKNQNKMVAEYIKDYVDENYMKQDTNAGNIAERFGVSASYIGTLFREQEKTTITKYITQRRISKAAELLSGTKLQIQAISKKVGYSDQNYFARIFKKQTGLSPGEYRNKCSH